MAPPNLTQLLDEDMQPTARYRVNISGAVSQDINARLIRGGFSTLIFRVQNTSSGEFYYYWVVGIFIRDGCSNVQNRAIATFVTDTLFCSVGRR